MTVAPILPANNERLSLQEGKGNSLFVYVLTLISAIGGFLFGYDTGVVSGAMILIKKQMKLDSVWHELIVSVTVGTAWLFSLCAGTVSDLVGRKPAILGASLTFAAGAVVMGVADSKEILLVGRAIVGAGIGMVSTSVPIYIAEASPIHLRGKLVSFHILMVAGGQFLGTIMAGAFADDPDNGWRYMLGLSGVPAVLQFVGFLGMPESPRWLVSKGRLETAKSTLRGIRGKDANIDAELDSVIESCREQDEARLLAGDHWPIYTIVTTSSVRRALVLGCCLQIFQQLAGINTVMYYSAAIIKMAGVEDDHMAIWLAAATAAVNFVCTFIGLYLVEKIGRRPLLLGSLIGVIVSLLVLAGGFQLVEVYAPPIDIHENINATNCARFLSCADCTNIQDCGFCFIETSSGPHNGSCIPNDPDSKFSMEGRCSAVNGTFAASSTISAGESVHFANDWCPTDYTWITLLGLGLYLFFFAPGMGPMPWTINSEIFPLWARGTAFSITTSMNWVANLLVSMTFLTLTEALTKKGAFYLYAGLSMLGFAFFYWVLPETKGCSLEEVDGLFARNWFSCSSKDRPSEKAIQYVHIRGLNRGYRDSNDSGEEDES